MSGNRITEVSEPENEQDAATKAYVDTKTEVRKLWENAKPTSTFYSQTITLDLSGYDAVSIYFKNLPSGAVYLSTGIAPKGNRITMQYVSTSGVMYHRHADIAEDGITFGAGQQSGENSNSAPVPIVIYGWKGIEDHSKEKAAICGSFNCGEAVCGE